MSQPSESESFSERLQGFEAPLGRLREVYHVPVLVALLAFMLWVRVKNYERFYVGGRVLYSGNDAWYHARMVHYTVKHFPGTMPFDPWTRFPNGTSVGQFGTLFDQLIALGALVYGLGSPTDLQVQTAILFAPAIFGTLVAIPAYLIGKRLAGKGAGLIAALIVALTPGQFLTRSLVGFSDHQVAESLFMAIAAYGVVVALAVAMRDKPVWELFEAREWDALRPTLVYSALAGLAVGLYIWVWPPGVFFVGILGIFFGLVMLGQYARGVSPDHLAVAGAVLGLVTTVVTLVPLNTFELKPTDFTVVQPGLSFALAVGVVAIAAGARLWDGRDLDRRLYPVSVLGLGAVVVLLASVLTPDLFGFFLTQTERVVGLGASATARTVGEAQPPQNPSQFLYNSYGLAFYTGIAGVAVMSYRVLTDRELKPDFAFVVVWSVFLLLATLTQQRFDYYLVLAVGATNAVLVAWVLSFLDLDEVRDDISNVSAYQVLTVLAVILVVAAPLAYRPPSGPYNNALNAADGQAQPGSVQNWDASLDWIRTQTPAEGAYGTGGEGDLEYYGTYERTDDFSYSEGSYGVMSWWDYGHWITVLGERIPFANPFQQGARPAANFLLSPNESYANTVMTSEDGEQTRYVMIDYQLGLAGTRKFTAPAAWETAHGVGGGDLSRPVYIPQGNGLSLAFSVQTGRSMESMRTRLYQHHGSAVGPESPSSALGQRVVVADWNNTRVGEQVYPVLDGSTPPLRVFENVSEAEAYVRQDGSARVGGVLGEPPRELPALQHYRLVHVSPQTAETPVSRAYRYVLAQQGQQAQPVEVQPWVKTFERVPGATVQGSGAPPNTTVTAAVRMRTPTTGGSFTYVQHARTDENGEFTMTLPYSTTGYDQYGPDNGYTNVSVRAATAYQFTTQPSVNESSLVASRYSGTANVTEAQVVGESDEPVQVELEEETLSEPEGKGAAENSSDSGNSTSTTGSGSGGSLNDSANSTESTDGGSANGSENGSASLARPGPAARAA